VCVRVRVRVRVRVCVRSCVCVRTRAMFTTLWFNSQVPK